MVIAMLLCIITSRRISGKPRFERLAQWWNFQWELCHHSSKLKKFSIHNGNRSILQLITGNNAVFKQLNTDATTKNIQ
jgi:hypothetical protein